MNFYYNNSLIYIQIMKLNNIIINHIKMLILFKLVSMLNNQIFKMSAKI